MKYQLNKALRLAVKARMWLTAFFLLLCVGLVLDQSQAQADRAPSVDQGASAQTNSGNQIFMPLFSASTISTITEAPSQTSSPQQRVASIENGIVQAAALSDSGQWGNIIPMPVVPVGAANLPNGKVLIWSAYERDSFTDAPNSQTYTAIFDPATDRATERLVTETGHDMFCPGTTNLADGRVLISGGNTVAETSIYDSANDGWLSDADLNIPRGYHAQTMLGDGSVFTIGGSWGGGLGGKDAELWSAETGWFLLPGIPYEPIVEGISDPGGIYRADNHAWLWTAPNGKILHVGPSPHMHWFDPARGGSYSAAGSRGDDGYSIAGTTVMFDVGKILKAGGASNYANGGAANNRAYVIDVNSDTAQVARVGNMAQSRTMHNSVVLPDGQVMVIGGLSTGRTFSEAGARLSTEVWNPTTEQWRTLAPISLPRAYHSVGILLPDARVLVGGSGFCNFSCPSITHQNIEIFSPPYLFDGNTPAARPDIISAPATADPGDILSVTTDSAVTAFSLIKLSSVTHSTNNDQRRIPLTSASTGTNRYSLEIPANPSVVLPGYYMLFAMNAAGTPSIAKTIKIGDAQPVEFYGLLSGGKPVVASSTQRTIYPASHVVDGRGNTRWASRAQTDPSWIQVDLGRPSKIDRVVIDWENAYATAYEVQVSSNGSTWTTIYSTSSGNGGRDDLTELSAIGRYVRVYGTTRALAPWGYSIWEIEVYGGPYTTPLGDVNCSGDVDSVDALFILQYTVGIRTDSGVCPLADSATQLHLGVGDVSDDERTNAVDALFILQCEVGMENAFCLGTF